MRWERCGLGAHRTAQRSLRMLPDPNSGSLIKCAKLPGTGIVRLLVIFLSAVRMDLTATELNLQTGAGGQGAANRTRRGRWVEHENCR